MKNKKTKIFCIILAIILSFVSILLIILLPKNSQGNENANPPNKPATNTSYLVRQNLNYNESIAKIDNPDQGFYFPVSIKIGEEGLIRSNTASALSQSNNYKLFHLRIDISELSGAINGTSDLEFSEAAQNALKAELNAYKSKDKNVIVRFAYDPDFAGIHTNCEPAFDKLLKHVKVICTVLNQYEDVITAVEAGMIGSWGEMTSNSAYMSPTY